MILRSSSASFQLTLSKDIQINCEQERHQNSYLTL